MNHQIKGYKLGRTTNQRRALKYSLVRSFVFYEKIVSTYTKVNFIQSDLEKLINLAKVDNLANFRRVLAFFRNDEIAARKTFDIAKKMLNRTGGYTRIIKMNQRKGDSAHQACIMLSGDAS